MLALIRVRKISQAPRDCSRMASPGGGSLPPQTALWAWLPVQERGCLDLEQGCPWLQLCAEVGTPGAAPDPGAPAGSHSRGPCSEGKGLGRREHKALPPPSPVQSPLCVPSQPLGLKTRLALPAQPGPTHPSASVPACLAAGWAGNEWNVTQPGRELRPGAGQGRSQSG